MVFGTQVVFFSEQWLADTEMWYQTHLRSIESGSAKLYNSMEWKSNLRWYKMNTRALFKVNDRLSESVIHDHLLYASYCDLFML